MNFLDENDFWTDENETRIYFHNILFKTIKKNIKKIRKKNIQKTLHYFTKMECGICMKEKKIQFYPKL
jgi:hypothetical protein